MTCKACEDIRTHCLDGPISSGFPNCMYCAARRIQFIQRRAQITERDMNRKCREALKEAMDWGHAEQQVRQLAKSTDWACEPVRGKR